MILSNRLRGGNEWDAQEKRQLALVALASNLYLLLYPRGPLLAAFRAKPRLAGAVFEALRQIDTGAFLREGRVYGGGLYKMEPKELGRLTAEPVVEAMGRWKPTRQRALFAER